MVRQLIFSDVVDAVEKERKSEMKNRILLLGCKLFGHDLGDTIEIIPGEKASLHVRKCNRCGYLIARKRENADAE